MAKRYARINWQNSPSTATPRNATNLNIMDKGIDDCDNAIEGLQGQVDTLNGNLTSMASDLAGKANAILGDFEGFQDLKGWVVNRTNSNQPIRIVSYGGLNFPDCPIGTAWGTVVTIGIVPGIGILVICISNSEKRLWWNVLIGNAGSENWANATWSVLT